MSQSAAANREADKLTQKLYKMPKARLLAGPVADCCVLCLFLKQQQGGARLCLCSVACCGLSMAPKCMSCPCYAAMGSAASLPVQHSLQMPTTAKLIT